MRISEWFRDTKYSLFRQYCRRYNIKDVEELLHFNFNNLSTINGVGPKKIEMYRNRFIKYTERNGVSFENYSGKIRFVNPEILIKKKKFNKSLIKLLPLFSGAIFKTFSINDFHESFDPNLPVVNLVLSKRAYHVAERLNIRTLGDLLLHTPQDLLAIKNCGKTTIREYQNLVEEYYRNRYRNFSNSWKDFHSMIKTVVQLKKRNFDILMLRFGYKYNKYLTLEKVGSYYKLTRERVRQILEKIMEKLNKKETLKKLKPFWSELDNILDDYFGMVPVSIIAKEISKRLDWSKDVPSHTLYSFLTFFNLYMLDNSNKLIGKINLKDEEKNISIQKRIIEILYNLTQKKDKIKYEDAISIILKECFPIDLTNYRKPLKICPEYIMLILEQNNSKVYKINYDRKYIYNYIFWDKYNAPVQNKICAIIKKHGAPITYEEIKNSLDEIYGTVVKKNKIITVIKFHPEIINWDRGKFVHLSNVKASDKFVDKINNYVYNKIKDNLYFINSEIIYNTFKEECEEVGIYTYTSLYYLLRAKESKDLIYPSYPIIYIREKYVGKQTMRKILEEYILSFEKPVNIKDINKFLKKELGLKDYLLSKHIKDSDKIVRINNRMISHINNIYSK